MKNNPTAAYIHIPFCRRRCYYCDFAISVVGDKPLATNSIMVSDYVSYLCQEIKSSSRSITKPLQTIFFGGGTPSLLPQEHLAKILRTLDNHLQIAPDAEISMEIDPGTFDLNSLQGYLNLGINRFSLGVQSFEPELLKICGRTHGLDDVYVSVDLIRQAQIKNFSLDLITGLPTQTLEQCQKSLLQAIEIAPAHLSCYDLVLEPTTAFGKQYQPGTKPLPEDETTAQMYRLTQNLLIRAGYQHYEISNYAQNGHQYQCQHNRVYWQNQPYYGFGMSAASYVQLKRFNRPRTRKTYYEWVKQGSLIDVDEISQNDYLLETLMLGFRLSEGLQLDDLSQKFGEQTTRKLVNSLEEFTRQGLVEIDRESKATSATASPTMARVKLTDPKGFLLSNTILASLFNTFSE